MSMKQVAALLAQITLSLAIGGAAFAQLPSLAPTAAQINREASAALRDLYSHNEAAEGSRREGQGRLGLSGYKKRRLHSRCAIRIWGTPERLTDRRLLSDGGGILRVPGRGEEIRLCAVLHDRFGACLP